MHSNHKPGSHESEKKLELDTISGNQNLRKELKQYQTYLKDIIPNTSIGLPERDIRFLKVIFSYAKKHDFNVKVLCYLLSVMSKRGATWDDYKTIRIDFRQLASTSPLNEVVFVDILLRVDSFERARFNDLIEFCTIITSIPGVPVFRDYITQSFSAARYEKVMDEMANAIVKAATRHQTEQEYFPYKLLDQLLTLLNLMLKMGGTAKEFSHAGLVQKLHDVLDNYIAHITKKELNELTTILTKYKAFMEMEAIRANYHCGKLIAAMLKLDFNFNEVMALFAAFKAAKIEWKLLKEINCDKPLKDILNKFIEADSFTVENGEQLQAALAGVGVPVEQSEEKQEDPKKEVEKPSEVESENKKVAGKKRVRGQEETSAKKDAAPHRNRIPKKHKIKKTVTPKEQQEESDQEQQDDVNHESKREEALENLRKKNKTTKIIVDKFNYIGKADDFDDYFTIEDVKDIGDICWNLLADCAERTFWSKDEAFNVSFEAVTEVLKYAASTMNESELKNADELTDEQTANLCYLNKWRALSYDHFYRRAQKDNKGARNENKKMLQLAEDRLSYYIDYLKYEDFSEYPKVLLSTLVSYTRDYFSCQSTVFTPAELDTLKDENFAVKLYSIFQGLKVEFAKEPKLLGKIHELIDSALNMWSSFPEHEDRKGVSLQALESEQQSKAETQEEKAEPVVLRFPSAMFAASSSSSASPTVSVASHESTMFGGSHSPVNHSSAPDNVADESLEELDEFRALI